MSNPSEPAVDAGTRASAPGLRPTNSLGRPSTIGPKVTDTPIRGNTRLDRLLTAMERAPSATPEAYEQDVPVDFPPLTREEMSEPDGEEEDVVQPYVDIVEAAQEAFAHLGKGLLESSNRLPTIMTTVLHLATLNKPMQVITYLLDKIISECEPTIVDFVRGYMNLNGDPITPQTRGFEVFGDGVLRLTKLYEQFKTHAAWQRLARVLIASIAGLFVATKMVSTRRVTDLVKGLTGIVSVNALVGGNLFEDALYVVKVLINALQSGSGLFEGFKDPERNTLELRFAHAMAMKEVFISQDWSLAAARNESASTVIKDFPVDDATFYGLLDHLCHDLQLKISTVDTKKTSADLFYYTRALSQVSALRYQVSDSVKRSGFKPAAFALALLGNSGVGKSVLIELIVSTLLKSIGHKEVKRLISNINSGDKYFSGLHNGHKAVIIDDAAARKGLTGVDAGQEMEVVRNFVGNQPIPLVSAALEDKGRIMPFVDLVGLTTNVWDLDAHNTAYCPFSVLRRILAMIEVHTKQEYWREEVREGGVVKVPNTLKTLRGGGIDTSVYLFNVKRIREDRGSGANGYQAKGLWVPQRDAEGELTGISWTRLMRYLATTFQAHVADQRGKVLTMKDFLDAPLCPHFVPIGTCDDCPPAEHAEVQIEHQDRPGVANPADEDPVNEESRMFAAFAQLGLMRDLLLMSTPWSIIDPLGGLCNTAMYKRECLTRPANVPTGWLATHILRRAWVKTLLCYIYAILHGMFSTLSIGLVIFLLFGPSMVYMVATPVVAGTFFCAMAYLMPFNGVLVAILSGCFSFVFVLTYTVVVIPLSIAMACVSLMFITLLRTLVAYQFIKVMVALSYLNQDAAARLQGGSIFTVNMKLVSGLSALVCMFLTGKLIYRLTRKERADISPSGLFFSKPPEQATEYVPSGPIVLPAAPVPPTERSFETTCIPPKNLTTLQDAWARKDIFQRYPPPPEHLATTTGDTLERKLESSTFRITLTTPDGQTITQTGLFLATNFLVMNAHGLYNGETRRDFTDYRVFRGDLIKACGKIHGDNWVRLKPPPGAPNGTQLDVVLLFLPSAPSCRDLRDMLVDNHPRETSAYIFGLDNDSRPYKFRTRVTSLLMAGGDVLGNFPALRYRCGSRLEKGFCGHPIVDTSNKILLGIHCGSDDHDESVYYGCAIFRTQVLEAIDLLRTRQKILAPLSAASVPAYGITPCALLSYGPVSNNSVLLQDPEANVSVLPSIKGYVVPRYRKTFVESKAAAVLENLGLQRRHLPPEDYGTFRVDKAKISSTKSQAHIPADVMLDASFICYEEDKAVFKHLPPGALGLLSICDAINGVGGLGPIPRSTSAGFPFKGKKRDYLTEMTRLDGTTYFEPTPELEHEVRTVWATLASGQRINAVYKASHKAELIKPGKSTRVFEGIPLPFYIVMRMVFGSVYAVYSAFALQLGTVGGINPFGRDWHYIYLWMKTLPDEMAGDYVRFDASGEPHEKHITFYDLIELMREFGDYDDETLLVASACVFEHIYHIGLFRGDLSEFYGVTASGCLLTLLAGNRINRQRLVSGVIVLARRHGMSLDLRTRPFNTASVVTTAGYTLPANYRDHIFRLCQDRGIPSIFDLVNILTMGDDFRMRVDGSQTPFINQRNLQAIFAEWDIVITDSHKNAVFSDLYTPEDEIDFLKRADRFDEELQIVRGPLTLASVFKPYYMYQPSPSISEELYLAGLMVVTEMELHMHGRDIYDEYHAYLEAIVTELDLGNFLSAPLRSYDEVTAAWISKYVERKEPDTCTFTHASITVQVIEYCSYCYMVHNYPPGSEAYRAHGLLLRFRYIFRQPTYQHMEMERINRELNCIFRRFNHLENTVAAQYPEDYDFWAIHSYFER